MKLERQMLRLSAQCGWMELLKSAARLGYCRGVLPNGREVVATADGADWMHLPSLYMKEQDLFNETWALFPVVFIPQ